MTQKLAAFDFDGTITKRDTLFPFLETVAGRRRAWAAMAAQFPLLRHRGDDDFRDRVKQRVLRQLMAGRSASQLATDGAAYSATLPRHYRAETVKLIEHHRQEGHHLVLVTASLQVYTEPAAAALGFDHVIGVELARDQHGNLTGEMAHPNVRGAQKASRLRAYVDSTIDDSIELWAYGNSDGDNHLLAMADHPTWIGRRAKDNET